MGSELLQAKPPAPAQTARPQHRYRLRFQKTGDLRLVSHIDLLHVFERLLRRAALPFASTQGFHPKPCLIFAQALALGVAGLDEVVDLTLAEPLPPEEVLVRLNRQAPAGLVFLEAKALTRKGSLQVRRAFYRLPLPTPDADLPRRCAALLARARCVAERLRPQRRLINIRPYLCTLEVDAGALIMTLWITPDGAARPEEVVKALGLGALLDAGAVLERTRLELMDDLPVDERWLPEIPRLVDAALDPSEVMAAADPAPQHPAGSSEPLIESPMSFET